MIYIIKNIVKKWEDGFGSRKDDCITRTCLSHAKARSRKGDLFFVSRKGAKK